jgi:hypothetical protein
VLLVLEAVTSASSKLIAKLLIKLCHASNLLGTLIRTL